MIAERKLAVCVPQGSDLNRMNLLRNLNLTSEKEKLKLKRGQLLKT